MVSRLNGVIKELAPLENEKLFMVQLFMSEEVGAFFEMFSLETHLICVKLSYRN